MIYYQYDLFLHWCVQMYLQTFINCYPPDQIFNPLITAAHQDGRFQANFSGTELKVSTVYHLNSPFEKHT